MEKKTIREAIVQVLKKANSGLSSKEITSRIVEQKLYHFNSKNPQSIVSSTIRKSCVGVELKLSRKERIFQLYSDGKFRLKDN